MSREIRHYHVTGCASCVFRETTGICSLQARMKSDWSEESLASPNKHAPPPWCPLRSVDIKLTFADIKPGETSIWPKIEEKRNPESSLDAFAQRMRARRANAAE